MIGKRDTLILVGVFVVLLIGLLLSNVLSGTEEATPTPRNTVPVDVEEAEDVSAIRVERAEDGYVTWIARNDDGEWEIVSTVFYRDLPVDQDAADRAAEALATLEYTRDFAVEDADMAGFGLEGEPEGYSIRIETASGDEVNLLIGAENPSGTGYYVMIEGGDRVYLVRRSDVDAITRLVANPPYEEPTPTPMPTDTPVATPTDTPEPTEEAEATVEEAEATEETPEEEATPEEETPEAESEE